MTPDSETVDVCTIAVAIASFGTVTNYRPFRQFGRIGRAEWNVVNDDSTVSESEVEEFACFGLSGRG